MCGLSPKLSMSSDSNRPSEKVIPLLYFQRTSEALGSLLPSQSLDIYPDGYTTTIWNFFNRAQLWRPLLPSIKSIRAEPSAGRFFHIVFEVLKRPKGENIKHASGSRSSALSPAPRCRLSRAHSSEEISVNGYLRYCSTLRWQ